MKPSSIVHTATAWDSIGFDREGDLVFRIRGGRQYYEAVMYNCANDAESVKLARLGNWDAETKQTRGLRTYSRYVSPSTVLEFFHLNQTASPAPTKETPNP